MAGYIISLSIKYINTTFSLFGLPFYPRCLSASQYIAVLGINLLKIDNISHIDDDRRWNKNENGAMFLSPFF